jgi:hypothetical protein
MARSLVKGDAVPDAAFKDLCMDVTAATGDAVAGFWAGALGLTRAATPDGEPGRLVGATPRQTVWLNTVPEERTAKTRLHLDVRLPSADPAPLLELGATLVSPPDGDRHWWLLADPDGTLFCAMGPHPQYTPPAPEPFELVVDAADPWAQARWWAEVTGGTPERREGAPYAWVEGAAGFPWRYWVFAAVPEPKTVKNRWHWDVTTPDPALLVGRGATILREPADADRWWVLADPEGNEFCAFTAD